MINHTQNETYVTEANGRAHEMRENVEWLTKLHDNESIGTVIERLLMNVKLKEESNTFVYFFFLLFW